MSLHLPECVCVLLRPGYTNPNGGNYLDTTPASRVDDIDWGLEAACCSAGVGGLMSWQADWTRWAQLSGWDGRGSHEGGFLILPLSCLLFLMSTSINQSINQSVFIYEALHHIWTHLKVPRSSAFFCTTEEKMTVVQKKKKHFCLELHWHLWVRFSAKTKGGKHY